MALVENDGAASLAPLSQERIVAALERDQIIYTYDSDNDLAAGWEHGGFFFLIGGESDEYLRVQGRWYASLSTDRLGEAIQACNEWNIHTIWPKTYAVANDVNEVVLMTEHSVDYEHGVTDAQISQHIACAISTGTQFFEYLNETFPQEWEAYQVQAEARAIAVAEAQAVAEAEADARYNFKGDSDRPEEDLTRPDSLALPEPPFHDAPSQPPAEEDGPRKSED